MDFGLKNFQYMNSIERNIIQGYYQDETIMGSIRRYHDLYVRAMIELQGAINRMEDER